ncbi:AAA family ATPase [Alteromonas macleodii]|uniref:AAA family ATPase n=1 Tax=Alteromonas macleodii TaxID=28108 RepID=UPI0031405EB1
MLLSVEIENVQHIEHCSFEVDLSLNQLQCLVGKNGCGKTTLVRAIRNLSINDTFQQTGAPYIFDDSSHISYQVGDKAYSFVFNKKLKAIDSRELIDKDIRQLFGVELPIPHGKRFSHFQELVKYDSDIRSKIANGDFEVPEELIQFLNRVYGDDRFNSLKKVSIKNKTFYAILRDPAGQDHTLTCVN